MLVRRSTVFFPALSRHVVYQIYDGRYVDPSTRVAINVIWELVAPAHGTVKREVFKGHVHFLSITDCPNSVYNPDDSPMEASAGLKPWSSQGYPEVSSVEAKAMAKAGLIDVGTIYIQMTLPPTSKMVDEGREHADG